MYFVFCLLNPHLITPTSPPMNIPIAFIPTVLGDRGLGSQTQLLMNFLNENCWRTLGLWDKNSKRETFCWFMGFSFLLSLFWHKSRDPRDLSRGDKFVGNAKGVCSPSPFFLLPCSFFPQPLTRNVLLSFCLTFPHFLPCFFPLFAPLRNSSWGVCTSPKSLSFQR